jgi:TolB-like protein/Tfp pilus assembly protein PilF
VLAFTNMSGDASQDYFSDGLAEELIDTLGLIAPIHVAARVSAFSFKGKDATITDIARALNVGTVLEGSVRRNGPRVRIAVQLIDGRTGYQTWSQTFDRDQGDILQLQGDIARAVTASLHVQLAGDDVAKLAQGGTANPLALDAYLRGRALKDGGDQSSATAQAALAEFDKAVALDPGYALAHTWRARTICDLSIFGTYSDPAVARAKVTEALQAADKAIALAPQLGVAHAIRAYVLANGMLDFVQADASLTRALKLAPDDPLVLTTYAYQEVDYGRFDAALAAEQRAASEDPLNPRSYDNLAVVQYVTRHYDDALANLGHEEALRGQSTIRIVAYMSMSQIMKGNAAAAQRICAAGHGWTSNLCLAIALRALDKPDEAKAALATLHATMGDGGAYQYAQVYAQWGDTAQAVQWLQTAYRLRDPGLVSLKVDPVLDPVRNAQGYKDIERQLNFPQ